MPEQGRVGDNAKVPADGHGCPACPHVCIGPGVAGSPDVLVNGKPALRVGDPGVHAACCGPNKWNAKAGAPGVFINGKKAHRVGDAVKHCGGSGKLIVGSPNVIVGDLVADVVVPEIPVYEGRFELTCEVTGVLLSEIPFQIHCPENGRGGKGYTDASGMTNLIQTDEPFTLELIVPGWESRCLD
jgi:uncharacterized Zn-binding protein involved in type VI secretion